MIATIAQWVATLLVAIGLIYTWRNNSSHRNQESRQRGIDWDRVDTKFKSDLTAQIKNIEAKLTDPQEGLGAIKREISAIKEHCAAVTSGCTERFRHVESDINDIKRGR